MEEGPPPGLGWGPTQHLMEVVIWILLPQLLPLPSPSIPNLFFLSPLLQSQVLSFFFAFAQKKREESPPADFPHIIIFSLEWVKQEKSLHIQQTPVKDLLPPALVFSDCVSISLPPSGGATA